MANDLQVYLLDPQKYSPETIAVAFAKTSRSPESFKTIADELNDAKSAEFNEKWVVGYGHSSVAEHAVLHVAVENISRLATECLESNRLASYTEKSTRYQTWNADAFFIPNELSDAAPRQEYIDTCHHLLDTYLRFIPLVNAALKKEHPAAADESAQAYERRIRSMTTDVCRFLLPSSVLANVGMTINARALEHALTKMLSNPLDEVRMVGQAIKSCAVEQIPTLLKYANAEGYLTCAEEKFRLPEPVDRKLSTWCCLVGHDLKAEDRILAACLFRFNELSYEQILKQLETYKPDEKVSLVKNLFECDNRHFDPLRELEHAVVTIEMSVDQGAFYEIKRHRMMTLTPQRLTADLGYAVPLAIEQAGLTNEYHDCMERVQKSYHHIAEVNREAAAYVIPNAYHRSFLMTSNLRSLLHFIKLRSAANAHFSVRRAAQQMALELQKAYPIFAPFFSTEVHETVEDIETEYFYQL
jgi:thymidylate synthase ThyX